MKLTDDRPILIVEDSDEDFEATLWALRKSAVEVPISRCRDGEQALDYLEHRGRFADIEEERLPALILLDLNLPRTDGREVLEHVKASAKLRKVPVVVLTTSANPLDVETCYRFGANSYLLKPVSMQKLREMVQSLIEYWFRIVLLPENGRVDGR